MLDLPNLMASWASQVGRWLVGPGGCLTGPACWSRLVQLSVRPNGLDGLQAGNWLVGSDLSLCRGPRAGRWADRPGKGVMPKVRSAEWPIRIIVLVRGMADTMVGRGNFITSRASRHDGWSRWAASV